MLMTAGITRAAMPDVAKFWTHLRGWRLDIQVEGAVHISYGDNATLIPQAGKILGMSDQQIQDMIGTLDPVRAVRIQQAYALAFFDLHLRHRGGASARRPERVLPGGEVQRVKRRTARSDDQRRQEEVNVRWLAAGGRLSWERLGEAPMPAGCLGDRNWPVLKATWMLLRGSLQAPVARSASSVRGGLGIPARQASLSHFTVPGSRGFSGQP
ncbi:hypothetical protein ABZ934_23495 [Streptomyces sp. NPDC046557]|uniref:hypothetical protein n=1 Tax=Streptomyces sp. NPDC046557 TaxID=3155372 RepID=UPI0033E19D94